jgi:hypothetical protein
MSTIVPLTTIQPDEPDDAIPIPPRRRRLKPPPYGRTVIHAVAIADHAIEALHDQGLELRLAGGHLFVQEHGSWRIATPADRQMLRVECQRFAEQFGKVTLGVLNAAWKALNASPRLFSREVPHIPDKLVVLTNNNPIHCPVAQWAAVMLVRMDHGRILRSDMIEAFHQWCAVTGDVCPHNGNWFFPRLRDALRNTAPHLRTITVNGTRYVGGVYWKQPAVDAAVHRSNGCKPVQRQHHPALLGLMGGG